VTNAGGDAAPTLLNATTLEVLDLASGLWRLRESEADNITPPARRTCWSRRWGQSRAPSRRGTSCRSRIFESCPPCN